MTKKYTNNFSSEDIELLKYILSEDTPLYNYEELSLKLNKFGLYLKKHQDYIVKTGMPPELFCECPWLSKYLGKLYHTRRTVQTIPNQNIGGNPSVPYHFLQSIKCETRNETVKISKQKKGLPNKTVIKSKQKKGLPNIPPEVFFSSEIDKHAKKIAIVDYEQSSWLPNIPVEVGVKLEAFRKKFLSFKIKVIEILSMCSLDKHNNKNGRINAWSKIYLFLTKSFKNDDIKFFLESDERYLVCNFMDNFSYTVSENIIPGGLSNLLNVIGHIDAEFRHGLFSTLRENISSDIISLYRKFGSDLFPLICKAKKIFNKNIDNKNSTVSLIYKGDSVSFTENMYDQLLLAIDTYRKHQEFESCQVDNYYRKLVPILYPDFQTNFQLLTKLFARHLLALKDQCKPFRTPFAVQAVPFWDVETGNLYYMNQIAKRIRIRNDKESQKPKIFFILKEFSDKNWPNYIKDPINSKTCKSERYELVKSLNKKLKYIEFYTLDDNIAWQERNI